MSSKYIIKKFREKLENIKSLKEGNKFHELELRFSPFGKKFESNIGEKIFDKVFKYYKDRGLFKNTIIIDKIIKNSVKFKFLDKNRYDLRKSNFLKKVTYNNDFEEITNDFTYGKIIQKEETPLVEYLLKEKKSNNTMDNKRLAYSIEHMINMDINKDLTPLHPDNRPFDIFRIKNRYSFKLDKNYVLDMTIVKTVSSNQPDIAIGPIEYIIEVELVNIDEPITLGEKLKEHMKVINRLYFTKEDFLFNIGTMNPQTMERNDLLLLKKYRYTVTDKADGERVFLMFYDKKIIFYNPKTQKVLREFINPTDLEDTIIDGEWLPDKNRYLAFDLIMQGRPGKNYIDKRFSNLEKRLKSLQKLVKKYSGKLANFFEYKMKTFYFTDIFDEAKRIWTNRKDLFDYELDGLIFTPVDQPYTEDVPLDIPVLKWKEKLSIDVRVEYNRRDNFTYFHGRTDPSRSVWGGRPPRGIDYQMYHNIINKPIGFRRWASSKPNIIKNVNNLNIGKIQGRNLFIGIDGTPNMLSDVRGPIWTKYDIMEYEYDTHLNQWIAIRRRTFDKEDPNAYMTIESVVNSVINYVSLTDVHDLKNIDINDIGVMYDLTNDNIKRKNWRKFNNHVKRELYQKVSQMQSGDTNYHMELAGGKGGDLRKWIDNGYKNILVVDISKEEIYGKNGVKERLGGMGFVLDGIYYKKDDMKVCIIWGDISKNIRNGDSALSKDDKDKLKKYFDEMPDNWKGFNSISIMFAIHYLFGELMKGSSDKHWVKSQETFEGFMKNITDNLRYDGNVFGTYLNGNNIKDDMEFSYNGEMMYKIDHITNNEIKEKTYDAFWKTENNKINAISIQNEVWGKDIKISEPKINKDLLNMMFKRIGMNPLIENTSTEQYIHNFHLELSMAEKDLVFINNTFIFGYVNVQELITEINEMLGINIYDKVKLFSYLKENLLTGQLDTKIIKLYNLLFSQDKKEIKVKEPTPEPEMVLPETIPFVEGEDEEAEDLEEFKKELE